MTDTWGSAALISYIGAWAVWPLTECCPRNTATYRLIEGLSRALRRRYLVWFVVDFSVRGDRVDLVGFRAGGDCRSAFPLEARCGQLLRR